MKTETENIKEHQLEDEKAEQEPTTESSDVSNSSKNCTYLIKIPETIVVLDDNREIETEKTLDGHLCTNLNKNESTTVLDLDDRGEIPETESIRGDAADEKHLQQESTTKNGKNVHMCNYELSDENKCMKEIASKNGDKSVDKKVIKVKGKRENELQCNNNGMTISSTSEITENKTDDKDKILNSNNEMSIRARSVTVTDRNKLWKCRTYSELTERTDNEFYISLKDELLKKQQNNDSDSMDIVSSHFLRRRKVSFTIGNDETDDKVQHKVQATENREKGKPLYARYGIYEDVLETKIGEWLIVDLDTRLYEKQEACDVAYVRQIEKIKRRSIWFRCLSLFLSNVST